MEVTRQAEEDALRILKLLDYLRPGSIKRELRARLMKIKNGEDPYKEDKEEK